MGKAKAKSLQAAFDQAQAKHKAARDVKAAAEAKLKVLKGQVTQEKSALELQADGRDKAITSAQNAATILTQQEHALAMQAASVYEGRVAKAETATRKAEN